jgi:hypothetical protein
MIGFLIGLSSAVCLMAWLIWRDTRDAPETLNPEPQAVPEDWRPRRPYRALL